MLTDIQNQKSIKYIFQSVILAIPQFANKRILVAENAVNYDDFSYYPWIVANITIRSNAVSVDIMALTRQAAVQLVCR